MSKIILCDVDLTVVNPVRHWWRWMEIQVGATLDYHHELQQRGIMPYDLSTCFRDMFGELRFDPDDFWRNEGIYDFMTPIPAAESVLGIMNQKGYDIRFVSHCKGNHHKSKYAFLKRNFPYLKGFAATKEKWMLGRDCDIFIDDRNDHLNKMPDSVIKIQHATEFEQFESLTAPNSYGNRHWSDIYELIENLEQRENND